MKKKTTRIRKANMKKRKTWAYIKNYRFRGLSKEERKIWDSIINPPSVDSEILNIELDAGIAA